MKTVAPAETSSTLLSTRLDFAADGGEGRAMLQGRRAIGVKRQRPARGQRDQAQDEDAARRIEREGMHAGEDAGADQECADQAERKGQDAEQDRPVDQRLPPLDDQRRMQERGAGQPGHEGGVLDRIPEPPAAPAQLVIGPEAAQA